MGEGPHATTELADLRIEKSEVPPGPRKMRRVFLVLLLGAVLGGLWYAYTLGILSPALPVQTAMVQPFYPSQALTLLNASGYVVAQRKASLAAKTTGRLVYLGVEEGSALKKGQLVARLENDDLLAARDRAKAQCDAARYLLDEARAELKDASLTYTRKRGLVDAKIISQADYDAVEARYQRALATVSAREAQIRAGQATLREAEVLLDYTSIRAPFDSVVLTKNADVGDIVTPIGAAANAKSAVVTVADMTSLQVELDVSEANIEQVAMDQPCEILLDALPDVRLKGKVHMIVPTAERTKASILVKVAFLEKDPRVLPEMSAKAAFLSRPLTLEEFRPVKAMPAAAVLREGKETWVFAVRGDRARRVPVALGRSLGDMVEILAGLEKGDRVILSPLQGLKEDARVVVPQE